MVSHNESSSALNKGTNLIINNDKEGIKLIINKIAIILNRIIENNEFKNSVTPTKFDNKKLVNMSIESYLERIVTMSEIEITTLVYSFALTDKLCLHSNISISRRNVFKILIVSLTTAAKMNEDYIFTEQAYSQIGGLRPKELVILEHYFLESINYNTVISNIIIENYVKSLSF